MKTMILALLLATHPAPEKGDTPTCVTLPDGIEFCVDAEDNRAPTQSIGQCKNINDVRICGA